MDEKPTLEVIATHLALAVRPLQDAVADVDSFQAFLYRLGWEVEDLPPPYVALGARVDEIVTALEGLEPAPRPSRSRRCFRKSGSSSRRSERSTRPRPA
jgi:hypothetical protein